MLLVWYALIFNWMLLEARLLNKTNYSNEAGGEISYNFQKTRNVTKFLKPVTVTIGRLTHIAIPFHQMDGTVFYSDEWSFVMRTSDDKPLFDRSWIQYNKEIRQIEAFPLKGNEGSLRYLIVPWIKNQKSLDRYFLDLIVKSEENVYMHQVVFNIGAKNSARFIRQRKFRIDFMDLLSTYLNSMGLYVRQNQIQVIDANPSTGNIKWLLTNIKPSTCDKVITKQLPKLMLKDNKPNMNLLTVFSRKAVIISEVKIELFPPCTFFVEETQTDTNNKFLAPLIIVIVIIVLVSPVAIALVIRRKFKSNRDRFHQTHATNYPKVNRGLAVDHIPNYGGSSQGKISFSCWMFSRKGKSFKINREYQNRTKYTNENIFDPNFLQRQRLTKHSTNMTNNSPGQYHSHIIYKDPMSLSSKKRRQRQFSGLSEGSSHASYSTSQDTHHSSFSIDKRHYSPTYYQPGLYQGHQQHGGSVNFLDTKCRQHAQSDDKQHHRNSNQSRDSRSNSLIQSAVNKVCNYIVNDNSSTNNMSHSRRPSVHLINIKPKTVNIHTPSHYHQKEPSSTISKPNQIHHINNNNQHSLERNGQRQQDYLDSSRYYNLPRRHSLDTRQDSLLQDSQKAIEKKYKHVTSRSTTNTPTKSSTLKVNTLNRNHSRSAEHAYHPSVSMETNQRIPRAPSVDYVQHRSRSAADLKRSSSLTNIVCQQQNHIANEDRYYDNVSRNGQQHQQQKHNKEQTQYQATQSTDSRERKTSLVRRQEFLASRRNKAVELCSHEEIQHLCRMQPTAEDYEDTV